METIIIANILKGIVALANFYLFLMFIFAIFNLLGMFGIINIFSGGVLSNIYNVLRSIILPATNFINRFVPRMGSLDLGFLILVIVLWIVIDSAEYYLASLVANSFNF